MLLFLKEAWVRYGTFFFSVGSNPVMVSLKAAILAQKLGQDGEGTLETVFFC